MRDMSSYYFSMKQKDLLKLRSQKVLAIQRERRHFFSYASAQEIKRLTFAISRIDAVLAARASQLALPE